MAATKEAMLMEAYRRGILPPEQAAMVEEAQRRGLLDSQGEGSGSDKPTAPLAVDGSTAADNNGEGLPAVDSYAHDVRQAEREKLIGAGRGFTDAFEGAKQLVLDAGEKFGLVKPADRQAWEQAVEQERRLYDKGMGDSTPAAVARTVGGILPYAAIPGPEAATSLPAKLAAGAGTGAAVGASQFVPEGGSRAENVAIGALAGAGGTAALEGAGRVTGKVVNAARGKAATPEADELQRLSAEHDVPLSYGDIQGGAIAPKLETATEYVPGVGMGNFRKVQHGKAEAAARQMVDDLKPADDDWAAIAQGSLRKKSVQVRRSAAEKYDRVAKLADPLGDVPTPTMQKVAKDIIEFEQKKPAAYQDRQLLQLVTKYTEDPKTNFSGLRAIRSDLGDEIADHYRGANALVGRKGARHLQAIKDALEVDLDRFAKQHGGKVRNTWKLADSYYRNRVVPFKDSSLARAAKSDTPDEIYRKFIQRGKRDRALKFYKALDQDGRQAVRYKMVEDAFEQASRGEHFSPATFARKLEDIEKATGVFFHGLDKRRLNGLTKLMRHAQRAGQYMENPPTGQRVIPYLAAGAFAIRPGEAASVAGASWLIKKLTTHPLGKRLLLAASKAKPGSTEMEEILKQLERQLPKGAAAVATRRDPESGSQEPSRQMPQSPSEQTAAAR